MSSVVVPMDVVSVRNPTCCQTCYIFCGCETVNLASLIIPFIFLLMVLLGYLLAFWVGHFDYGMSFVIGVLVPFCGIIVVITLVVSYIKMVLFCKEEWNNAKRVASTV